MNLYGGKTKEGVIYEQAGFESSVNLYGGKTGTKT